MKKGKLGITLFSAVALLAILLTALHTQAPVPGDEQMLAVQIATETGTRTLEVWTEDWENFYVFLPGHVTLEQAMLQANGEREINE